MRKAFLVSAIAASMTAGGAIGAALFSSGSAAAQSPAATTSVAAPTSSPSVRSNENATHEKQETAADETAEASGKGHCAHGQGATPTRPA